MTDGPGSGIGRDSVPPTNKRLIIAAGVLLLIPIVALMWVSSYARVTPRLWGFPFFFWYQFLWIIIGAVLVAVVYFRTERE